MRQIEYKVDCGIVAAICFSISIKGVNVIRGHLIKNNSKLVCVDRGVDTLCVQGN